MKKLIFPLLILATVPVFLFAQEADTLHLSVQTQILVFDRSTASDDLSVWAEQNGGYFTWKSEESIRIRIPDEKVIPFRAYLENVSDVVIQYDQSAQDLRETLMSSRSALEAREEILIKNLSYLSTSDVEGTLELEREIRRLMAEIDSYRGLLRRLEHDRSMAVIEVSLSFRQQTIPDSLPSNFAWINSLDFYSFMNFQMTRSRRPGLGRSSIELPDGFALIDKFPVYKAISPEGVRLRIRDTDNYPEQSVDFWVDALTTDLQNRGYLPVESTSGDEWGNDKTFNSLLWAVPWGNEDYLYLTALRLTNGKIEILEMAGKAEFMLKYLEK
jgi:hypothetical protein